MSGGCVGVGFPLRNGCKWALGEIVLARIDQRVEQDLRQAMLVDDGGEGRCDLMRSRVAGTNLGNRVPPPLQPYLPGNGLGHAFGRFGDLVIERVQREQMAAAKDNKEALDKLMPIVYNELRQQAARYLRREQAGHTLQTTALIHEAYVRLVDQRNVQWQNRAHFFGIAAQMMRRILVDHARTKKRAKRGGSDVKVSLADATIPVKERDLDVVALDEALTRLAEIDEQQSRVVELRFFSGLTVEETAEVMGISPATVKRDWSMAKAWLHRELSREI